MADNQTGIRSAKGIWTAEMAEEARFCDEQRQAAISKIAKRLGVSSETLGQLLEKEERRAEERHIAPSDFPRPSSNDNESQFVGAQVVRRISESLGKPYQEVETSVKLAGFVLGHEGIEFVGGARRKNPGEALSFDKEILSGLKGIIGGAEHCNAGHAENSMLCPDATTKNQGLTR